jgi:biotin carboxylase
VNRDVLIVHGARWLGIARLPVLLRAGGARVTIMAPRDSYLMATAFADEKIAMPAGTDEFVEALRVHLSTRRYALVVIGDDGLLTALAERASREPWIAGILPVPLGAPLEMLTSKLAFLDRCREAGLPIARSENVASLASALEAAGSIGYPVMLKLAIGSGGSGVKRIDSAPALQAEFDAFARGECVTVERFVEGKVCGCETLFDHGRPVCWSPFYKYRCFPRFGPSAVRMLYAHPQLQAMVERLGALTHFHGFATFCFIHDERRDELVLLELNFRPGTGMHVRGPIRTMFAQGVAALLRGEPSPGRRTHGIHGQLVSLFPQDLQRVLAEGDYAHFVRSTLRGRFWADAPFEDPPLLALQLRNVARDALPARLRSGLRRVLGRAAAP